MGKRAQEGSAANVVLLLVVAVMLWWQWDWISEKLGFGAAGAGLEVVDYRCDKQDGRGRFEGRVRNASEKPVELRAVTAIYDSSGKKSDYNEATVRPAPLKPGQVGDFRGETAALPDGGSCRLDHFVDSTTGNRVGRQH